MSRTRRSEAGARADGELRYWGYHVGKQFAADGYPDQNPLLMLLSGHSDLNPLSSKFGVNVKDVPAEAWRINGLVLDVPDFPARMRTTLIARYCLPPDYETGQPFEAIVIAEALGMPLRSYFRRLSEARERYLSISVGAGGGIRGIRELA